MHKVPKKAKKSGQFSGSVGQQPVPMAPVNFTDTTNQTGVSSPCKWSEIYDFISVEKCSNKPPLMEVRDSDEEFSNVDVYDKDLLKVQIAHTSNRNGSL